MRQRASDPPLRIHMVPALLEGRRLLDVQAGLRKPDAPRRERGKRLAKVLPFGERPSCSEPSSSPALTSDETVPITASPELAGNVAHSNRVRAQALMLAEHQ